MNRVDLSQSPDHLFADLESDDPTLFELYQGFKIRYPFELDLFQKYAVYGLLKGENVLVTVPTSCGKTVIAEYAIYECFNLVFDSSQSQSRVIYTSPIKTLSNQKYSEFKSKFGAEDVGIITGDVKFNPDARLVIMTTEILRDLVLKRDPILEQVKTVFLMKFIILTMKIVVMFGRSV